MGVEINHEILKNMLKTYRKKGLPLFVKGATGIGKTEGIILNAKDYAVEVSRNFKAWTDLSNAERKSLLNADELRKIHLFVDVRTALLEPTDLMGLPSLNGEFVEWKPTLLFKVLSMPEVSATIFFDEFNLGSRMVQNASYQIILDKAIGETKLGKDVFVVAAGNRAEDKANIIETPMPLNNRFGHATLVIPTSDEWIEYNLASAYAEPRICAFLKFKRDLVHNYNPSNKDEAFATPRAIQQLASLIFDMDAKNDLDEISLLAKSKCGESFGSQFSAFMRLSRKVDIDEVLKNPEMLSQFADDLDLRYSIISGVAIRCRENWAKAIYPSLLVADNLFEEEGVFLFRMIIDLVGKPKVKNYLLNDKDGSKVWAEKLSKKFAPIMGNW
jgi:hypothetical protein